MEKNYNTRNWKNKKVKGFVISSKDLEKQKLEFIKRGGKVTKLDSQIIYESNIVNSDIKNLDAAGYGL